MKPSEASQTGNLSPLAFVDAETTGLDENVHEIIELAVLRVDPVSFDVISSLEAKVLPTRLDLADPRALEINGFSAERWGGAVPLKAALMQARPLLQGATLAGHNVGFDKRFLDAAWRQVGLEPPKMDYHVLDTATLTWPLARLGVVERPSLSEACTYLGIDGWEPHRAQADAYRSLEVAREIIPAMNNGMLLSELPGDARDIADMSLERLQKGSEDYGPWDVEDGRDWGLEALEELADAAHYLMAELIRFRRRKPPGGRSAVPRPRSAESFLREVPCGGAA